MTPGDVLPFVGQSPAAVQARTAIGAAARAKMRSERRCETLPAFRDAVEALVDVAYPAWFRETFWVDAPSQDQLRPCAAGSEEGSRSSVLRTTQ